MQTGPTAQERLRAAARAAGWSAEYEERTRLINLTGRQFGNLLVRARAGYRGKEIVWAAECACGTRLDVLGTSLRHGRTRSCGCLRTGQLVARFTTHGACGTPTYETWKAVVQRCTNPTNPLYPKYGGRGITICLRWRRSFAAFLSDMGTRPSLKHSIDRKNNTRGYFHKNCRWATRKEQAVNRRSVKMLTVGGLSMCASDWARALGLAPGSVLSRLQKNIEPTAALKITDTREAVKRADLYLAKVNT